MIFKESFLKETVSKNSAKQLKARATAFLSMTTYTDA